MGLFDKLFSFLKRQSDPVKPDPKKQRIDDLIAFQSEEKNIKYYSAKEEERKKELEQQFQRIEVDGTTIAKVWRNAYGLPVVTLGNKKVFDLEALIERGLCSSDLLVLAKEYYSLEDFEKSSKEKKIERRKELDRLLDSAADSMYKEHVDTNLSEKGLSSSASFHCWRCGRYYGRSYTPVCPLCNWNVCPSCGACASLYNRKTLCQNTRIEKLKKGEIHYPGNFLKDETVLFIDYDKKKTIVVPVQFFDEKALNSAIDHINDSLQNCVGTEDRHLPFVIQSLHNRVRTGTTHYFN